MPSSVTIGSDTYNIYGTLAEADTHLNAQFGIGTNWTALAEDDRERALVQGSNVLDLLDWQGTRVDTATPQPRAFPRVGLPECDGVQPSAVDDPLRIEQASYELAYLISQGQFSVIVSSSAATNAANLKKVEAGSAAVEFFSPGSRQSFTGSADLPPVVLALVECLLASSAPGVDTSAAQAFGTGQCSEFDVADRYNFDEGLG